MINWLNKKTSNPLNTSFYINSYLDNNNATVSKALPEIKEKIGEARHCPPASQEWINSVYSYNKSFTKVLPMTDSAVNRLIKSYFSLTPLLKGKKSKRVQIRFRRLSLNRILVSKAEMKHTNSKVIITVYLYNKNKKTLMHRLKNIYRTFVLKMPAVIKNKTSGKVRPTHSSLTKHNNNKSTIKGFARNKINIKKVMFGKSKQSITNKINLMNYKPNNLNLYKTKKKPFQSFANSRKFATKRVRKPSALATGKNNIIKIYNYINSIDLTNKRLSKFFVKLKNTNLKNKYKALMRKYYYSFSKYKLYSSDKNKYFLEFANISANANKETLYTSQFYNMLKGNIIHSSNNINPLGFHTRKNKKKTRLAFVLRKLKQNKTIKNLMHKVRNFYKLFLLKNLYKYNTISIDGIGLINTGIYKNMYKLIKKTSFGISASKSQKRINAISLKAVSIIKKARKRKTFILRVLKWKDDNFTNYEYKYYQNFIKKAYKKEMLYMYYKKLLFINNNKFKNWFILGLKKVVSKLYNKKVEFNFVNLKYLHLNSEIFSESIATKLRNRENRLLTVLKKALKLVKLSHVNTGFTNTSFVNNKYKKSNASGARLRMFNGMVYSNNDILQNLLHNVFSTKNTESNNTTTSENVEPLYNKTDKSIGNRNVVLDSIKHKNVLGVRLEARGRLSKRLTASRSIFKLKYKGSIKNVDSSFKALSSVILRGNIRPNIQYTKISMKTRNGSFGLKGWVSGY